MAQFYSSPKYFLLGGFTVLLEWLCCSRVFSWGWLEAWTTGKTDTEIGENWCR